MRIAFRWESWWLAQKKKLDCCTLGMLVLIDLGTLSWYQTGTVGRCSKIRKESVIPSLIGEVLARLGSLFNLNSVWYLNLDLMAVSSRIKWTFTISNCPCCGLFFLKEIIVVMGRKCYFLYDFHRANIKLCLKMSHSAQYTRCNESGI